MLALVFAVGPLLCGPLAMLTSIALLMAVVRRD
jgi:hypothetical protein